MFSKICYVSQMTYETSRDVGKTSLMFCCNSDLEDKAVPTPNMWSGTHRKLKIASTSARYLFEGLQLAFLSHRGGQHLQGHILHTITLGLHPKHSITACVPGIPTEATSAAATQASSLRKHSLTKRQIQCQHTAGFRAQQGLKKDDMIVNTIMMMLTIMTTANRAQ